jgi:hypothetical protein
MAKFHGNINEDMHTKKKAKARNKKKNSIREMKNFQFT